MILRTLRLWAFGLSAAVLPAVAPPAAAQTPPYPRSQFITDFDLDWSTFKRQAVGSDNWHTTWSSDNKLYSIWGDGGGLGTGAAGSRVSIGMARLEGNSAATLRGRNLMGGLSPTVARCFPTIGSAPEDPYQRSPCRGQGLHAKSWGVLARGSQVYAWIMPRSAAESLYSEARIHKVPRGTDNWTRASWAFTARDAVHLVEPTFLQAGQDYADISDYLYMYAIRHAPTNSNTFSIHRSSNGGGQIMLMRVRKSADPMQRDSYEFFAGTGSNNAARWSRNIGDARAAISDPKGVGWTVSATYVKSLKRYFVITEHEVSQRGRMSIFESPNPHGPWRTVFYDELTDGSSRVPLTAFFANFLPNGFSDGGRRFTLSFTGIMANDALNLVDGRFTLNERYR